MIVTKQDGIRAARQAIANYSGQAGDLRDEQSRIESDKRKTEQDLQDSYSQLATGLLPSPETEIVKRAANETGAIHLPDALRKLEEQRAQFEERIRQIEEDEEYRDRALLTHPETGEYSLKIKDCEETVATFEELCARFDFKEFQWLYKRDYHTPREHSSFGNFWRVITFADRREANAEAVVLERIDEPTFMAAAERYEQYLGQRKDAREELEDWRKKRDNILNMVAERDRRLRWVSNFESEALEALRMQLASHFEEADLDALHKQVRPPARVLVAKAHAQQKKIAYFEDLVRYLENEIADRERRIQSISRVQRKWQQRPYGMLQGNKSKWLVDVPEMKRGSTTKRVRWVRTMHGNIDHYDNYGAYSVVMGGVAGFLAYDLIAMASPERMPYEGFTRSIVGELDQHREEHGQEGADYGEYQEAMAAGAAWELGMDGEAVEEMDWEATEAEAQSEAADALAEEAEGGEDEAGDES